MPSITGSSTIDFLSLSGSPQGIGYLVEEITRPGVDGHAYRRVGLRSRPFDLTGTRDCLDGEDALAIYEALLAMRGTIVEVLDDHASTWVDMILLDVELVDRRPIGACAGGVTNGAGKCLLVVRATLQKTKANSNA